MTEAEWLSCADSGRMLVLLRCKVSDRKWRLLACACCRILWSELNDHGKRAIKMAERFADGQVMLGDVEQAVFQAAQSNESSWHLTDALQALALPDADSAADSVLRHVPAHKADRVFRQRYKLKEEDLGEDRAYESALRWADDQRLIVEHQQCRLLREVIHPFQPMQILSSLRAWHDGTILRIAQNVYDDSLLSEGMLDVSRLGILADALLDAGCENEEVFQHCRAPGLHVRGCWAVDLILGKS